MSEQEISCDTTVTASATGDDPDPNSHTESGCSKRSREFEEEDISIPNAKRRVDGEGPNIEGGEAPVPESAAASGIDDNAIGKEEEWSNFFHMLLEYSKEHGHCNVSPPRKTVAKGSNNSNDGSAASTIENISQYPGLYEWLHVQRQKHSENALTEMEAMKLQTIVNYNMLSWDLHYEEKGIYRPLLSARVLEIDHFEDNFFTLVGYGETHGHCNLRAGIRVSTVRLGRELDLGAWVVCMRKEKAINSINPEFAAHLDLLVEEGLFTWDPVGMSLDLPPAIIDLLWNRKFNAVRDYVHQTGLSVNNIGLSALKLPLAPASDPEMEKKISRMSTFDVGCWITLQRYKYRNDTIRNDHCLKLQELLVNGSLQWYSPLEYEMDKDTMIDGVMKVLQRKENEEDELWIAWYNVLLWYGRRHGHCNIDTKATVTLPDGSEAELGKWLHQQRSAIKHARIKPNRIAQLQVLVSKMLLNESWGDLINLYTKYVQDCHTNGKLKNVYEDLIRLELGNHRQGVDDSGGEINHDQEYGRAYSVSSHTNDITNDGTSSAQHNNSGDFQGEGVNSTGSNLNTNAIEPTSGVDAGYNMSDMQHNFSYSEQPVHVPHMYSQNHGHGQMHTSERPPQQHHHYGQDSQYHNEHFDQYQSMHHMQQYQ